jgi:hypothetical protein
MRIDSFYRKNLRNDEHFQLNTEFRDLIIKEGAENLKEGEQFAAYQSSYNKEDEGIKRVSKSLFTEKIQEADKARDDIYSGMVEINEGSLKHYNPSVREAAKKLKILFDTYGNLSHKPLNEQTSAVNNILQELKGNYLEATRTVQIDGWANELEARNNAFDVLVKGRADEAAAKTDVVVKQARVELDGAYDAVVERINAYAVIEGGEMYERFIKTFNFVIAKYNAIVNARLGRRNHKPAGEHETAEVENV